MFINDLLVSVIHIHLFVQSTVDTLLKLLDVVYFKKAFLRHSLFAIGLPDFNKY